MLNRKYVFETNDLKFLKHDFWVKFVLFFLSVLAFSFQIYILVSVVRWSDLTMLKKLLCCAFIIMIALFTCLTLCNVLKRVKDIALVKSTGKSVGAVFVKRTPKNLEAIRGYSIVSTVIERVAIVAIICLLIYSIINFNSHSNFSFYLPIAICTSLSAINSAHHVKSEMYVLTQSYEIDFG